MIFGTECHNMDFNYNDGAAAGRDANGGGDGGTTSVSVEAMDLQQDDGQIEWTSSRIT